MISPTSSETFNQIICLETIPCPFFIFIFFFITLFILFASQTWPPPNPPFTQSLPLPLPLLLWQDVVPLGKHSTLSIKSAELSTSSLTKVRELSPVRGTGSTDRQQSQAQPMHTPVVGGCPWRLSCTSYIRAAGLGPAGVCCLVVQSLGAPKGPG